MENKGEINWKSAVGKFLLLVLVILIIVFPFIYKQYFVRYDESDIIVRVSFTGIENMFHIPYEYYAVSDKYRSLKIPNFATKYAVGVDAEEKSIYDDRNTSYWFVTFQYGVDKIVAESGTFLETSFGSDYWIIYNKWTKNSKEPTEEEIALMQNLVKTLHNGDLENWIWQGGGAIGLTSFMMIANQGRYLFVVNDEKLLMLGSDGVFHNVMTCPDKGRFDYYFFKN